MSSGYLTMSFDDDFNVEMANLVQQFYTTADSSSEEQWNSQELYTSPDNSEQIYFDLDSNIIESYTQMESLQDSETSNTVIQSPASESEETSPVNQITLVEIEEPSQFAQLIYRGEKQVRDDVFERNPCMLSHNCVPLDRYQDKANRTGYQACQTLRKDKHAYRTTPYRHFSEAAQSILTDSWRTIDERRKVLGKFYGSSYEQRRKTFSKAASAQKRVVEPNNVPEDLRHVPGGDIFLQLQTDDLHVYFCRNVIELAQDNGLYALIGDGVHKLNPVTIPNRMDKGQLYVVHGAIQGGIEVPLLYAVTRYKSTETYKIIFESLREVLGEFRDRFVLDFEKAAIRAARETFPEADVQGCAFHLAQAWNRMAANLGVRKFTRGPNAILAVKKMVGDFERGMWSKWDMQDFRTTNTAEAFHSKLRGMLSRRINPPFEELLECLHSINSLTIGQLMHVSENAQASKVLRRKDQERRHKINQAMNEFKEIYTSSENLGSDVIDDFCRKMSKFVTEKTI